MVMQYTVVNTTTTTNTTAKDDGKKYRTLHRIVHTHFFPLFFPTRRLLFVPDVNNAPSTPSPVHTRGRTHHIRRIELICSTESC